MTIYGDVTHVGAKGTAAGQGPWVLSVHVFTELLDDRLNSWSGKVLTFCSTYRDVLLESIGSRLS